jgi:folate-binding protein YgfZ
VKLEWREDLARVGRFGAPARARGAAFEDCLQIDAEDVDFDLGADGGARTLHFAARNVDRYLTGHLPPDPAADRWKAFDLAHGLPRLLDSQSEAWTPQMLSLDRLAAFSLKKGCYPGQEIVARTHYLGQAKRELARVVGARLQSGSGITAAGQALGTIVAAIGEEALAVVSVDRPPAPWESDGAVCTPEALLTGLER